VVEGEIPSLVSRLDVVVLKLSYEDKVTPGAKSGKRQCILTATPYFTPWPEPAGADIVWASQTALYVAYGA
jgi:hypothetical protein